MTDENIGHRQTAVFLRQAIKSLGPFRWSELLLGNRICALATEQAVKPSEVSVELLRVLVQTAQADLINRKSSKTPIDEYWFSVYGELVEITVSGL